MGMFDHIRCRMPLPSDPPPPAIEWFQTKDVPTPQLYMEQWTIEEDGRLIHHACDYEQTPVEELPDPTCRWRGSIRRINLRDEPHGDFHGDIEFYE
jgi:hypothetical protein